MLFDTQLVSTCFHNILNQTGIGQVLICTVPIIPNKTGAKNWPFHGHIEYILLKWRKIKMSVWRNGRVPCWKCGCRWFKSQELLEVLLKSFANPKVPGSIPIKSGHLFCPYRVLNPGLWRFWYVVEYNFWNQALSNCKKTSINLQGSNVFKPRSIQLVGRAFDHAALWTQYTLNTGPFDHSFIDHLISWSHKYKNKSVAYCFLSV